jgi:hypothetical protein
MLTWIAFRALTQVEVKTEVKTIALAQVLVMPDAVLSVIPVEF